MKSLQGFLKRIASKLLLTPRRLEAISSLDPEHIYVENVRALFGISTGLAHRFCEIAVRQGILRRQVEVLCPDQTVSAEASTAEKLPRTVKCWEEIDGVPVEREYETSRLRKMEFYVLRDRTVA